MNDLVFAVDGGNSKTDLALVRTDGELLALVRGPLSSPHHVGVKASLDVIERLLDEATDEARLAHGRPLALVASLQLAGVDFPDEEERLREAAAARSWAKRILVGNDTFALLRTGSEHGWGVAVVCGAGINCLGVGPDGRHARFPALGAISGDWGGGYDLGVAALSAAARSEDGRGPRTALEQLVPAHFGLAAPHEVAEAIHVGRLDTRRLVELAPLVLGAAQDDAVAAEIVDRLAREVVAFARAALERLDLLQQPAEVVLGGGVLAAGDGRLVGSVEQQLRAVAPATRLRVTSAPPVVGAALLALDAVDADDAAKVRLRAAFEDRPVLEPARG